MPVNETQKRLPRLSYPGEGRGPASPSKSAYRGVDVASRIPTKKNPRATLRSYSQGDAGKSRGTSFGRTPPVRPMQPANPSQSLRQDAWNKGPTPLSMTPPPGSSLYGLQQGQEARAGGQYGPMQPTAPPWTSQNFPGYMNPNPSPDPFGFGQTDQGGEFQYPGMLPLPWAQEWSGFSPQMPFNPATDPRLGGQLIPPVPQPEQGGGFDSLMPRTLFQNMQQYPRVGQGQQYEDTGSLGGRIVPFDDMNPFVAWMMQMLNSRG